MANNVNNNFNEPKGNRGEWSEIYALFYLLGKGKLQAGDQFLRPINGLFYHIVKIIRSETDSEDADSEKVRREYLPNNNQNVVIMDGDGNIITQVPMRSFLEQSKKLLNAIQNQSAKKGAFTLPQTETFMKTVECRKLKASSEDKADIHIIIHDPTTSSEHELGFSIKSFLGSAPTLLNASSHTNFVYQIIGDTKPEIIQIVNQVENQNERIQKILDLGLKIQYFDVESRKFKNNLLFIDSCMPELIGECLLESYILRKNGGKHIKDVVASIADKNPLNFQGDSFIFYSHKVKTLLVDVALGMMPATPWDGIYDANGGYIVVRSDGQIVCYHFYDRNKVEDYLFMNTRFESPSRSKFGWGDLYKDGQKLMMKLNLQIRFC